MQTKHQQPKKQLAKIKYTAYVAASIDGRIAKDSLSSVDWTSQEDWDFFQNVLKKTEAVVVGHHTFKVSEDRLKWRNTIVLTSKVDKIKIKNKTVFLNPEKYSLEKFLHSQNYKKVAVIGGGMVYDFCLRHNMLDELFVTIEPYVFTAGVPMFTGAKFKKYQFILQSVKQPNKTGTIFLKYKIKHQDGN